MKIPKNCPKTLKTHTRATKTPPESSQITLIPPPHQRTMRQNSLEGLPQYNGALYGHVQWSKAASPLDTATLANMDSHLGTFVTNDKGILEPGGVEIELNMAKWM